MVLYCTTTSSSMQKQCNTFHHQHSNMLSKSNNYAADEITLPIQKVLISNPIGSHIRPLAY